MAYDFSKLVLKGGKIVANGGRAVVPLKNETPIPTLYDIEGVYDLGNYGYILEKTGYPITYTRKYRYMLPLTYISDNKTKIIGTDCTTSVIFTKISDTEISIQEGDADPVTCTKSSSTKYDLIPNEYFELTTTCKSPSVLAIRSGWVNSYNEEVSQDDPDAQEAYLLDFDKSKIPFMANVETYYDAPIGVMLWSLTVNGVAQVESVGRVIGFDENQTDLQKFTLNIKKSNIDCDYYGHDFILVWDYTSDDDINVVYGDDQSKIHLD